MIKFLRFLFSKKVRTIYISDSLVERNEAGVQLYNLGYSWWSSSGKCDVYFNGKNKRIDVCVNN